MDDINSNNSDHIVFVIKTLGNKTLEELTSKYFDNHYKKRNRLLYILRVVYLIQYYLIH